MKPFPPLAYVCPIPWDALRGNERERFCEKCGHTITNFSALSAEARAALIARAESERVCITYYRRLTGEFVTPEHPLTADERSRIKQLGVAALSASALMLAAGCVTEPKLLPAPPRPAQVPAAGKTGDEAIVLQAFGMIGVDAKK